MSRTVQPEHRAALLDRIVDYAEKCGVAELSLRPLGTALGVSPRTLLYYFKSKDEMLIEALAQLGNRQRALFESIRIAAGASHAAVCREVWRILSAEKSRPTFRLFFEIYGIALQDEARFPGFLNRSIYTWIEFLERAPLREGRDPAQARSIATMTLATFRGLLLDLCATGDRARIDRAFESWIGEA